MSYELDKTIWTNQDFDEMGWHDATVHGISFRADTEPFVNELLLDIDYIFKWVGPETGTKLFSFFVAPCTLVFHDVQHLQIALSSGNMMLQLAIADIDRIIAGTGETTWKVGTDIGEITFFASGFTQFVRKRPLHVQGQELSETERGDTSFARLATD